MGNLDGFNHSNEFHTSEFEFRVLYKTLSEPVSTKIEINWVMCRDTCGGEGLCDKCGYQGRCCSGASENESEFCLYVNLTNPYSS